MLSLDSMESSMHHSNATSIRIDKLIVLVARIAALKLLNVFIASFLRFLVIAFCGRSHAA